MAYKKFDDPATSSNDAHRKVNEAFMTEGFRRALQGITNYVLQGTAGTGAFVTAGLAGGSTSGGKVTYPLDIVIDGIKYAVAAQDNIPMPSWSGTQGSNTVARYLFYVGTDGTAYITGPGAIIDKGLYTTLDAAEALAKLPDLPDNCCALGELKLNAPYATAVTTPRIGTVSTMGTAAYTDFIHMPFNS